MDRAKRGAIVMGLVLFVISFIPRLYIALQPIPIQLQRNLPDDAFYYYLTAQNLLDGHGPSVDGRNASNGWHPLWLAVNLLIFTLPFENVDSPVQLSLLIGAMADSLVAVMLFLLMSAHLSHAASFVGACVYAVNSMPLVQSVNGLETGLTALFISISFYVSLRLVAHPSHRLTIVWGLSFGLCFLARTDTALLLVSLGVFVLLNLVPRQRWSLILLGASCALLVSMPWFLWNFIQFGNPLSQSSGIAVPTAIRMRHELSAPGTSVWHLSVKSFLDPIPWIRGDYAGTPVFLGPILWCLGAIGLISGHRNGVGLSLLWACVALIIGGFALIAVHSLVRWYPRPWYFVVNAQALSIGLAFFWNALRQPKMRLVLVAGGAPLMLILGIHQWRAGYYPWQNRQYNASMWLQAHTPSNSVIASMNSGIMGYYSGRTVINLDGVVNPRAFNAIKNKELFSYIQDEGVDYFVDFDYALHSEYGQFMGVDFANRLNEIAQIDAAYDGLGILRIYRVSAGETD